MDPHTNKRNLPLLLLRYLNHIQIGLFSVCFKITLEVSVSHPIWKMLASDKIPPSVPLHRMRKRMLPLSAYIWACYN